NEHGNRKNKYKARLKFVLREKGIGELKRLVEEKRAQITTPAEVFTVASPVGQPLVNIAPLSAPQSSNGSNGNGSYPSDFGRWAEHNVMAQRQPGYSAAWVKLSAGNISSGQMRGLADLLDRHHLAATRIAIMQNFVIPWVPNDRIRQIYDELKTLDLAAPGA